MVIIDHPQCIYVTKSMIRRMPCCQADCARTRLLHIGDIHSVDSTQLLLLHCSIASMQLRSPVDTSAVEQQRSLTMVTSLNSLLPLFVRDPKKSPDNAGIWWLSCQFFGMHRFQLGCHNADWLAVFTRSQRKWGIIKLLLTSFASVFWVRWARLYVSDQLGVGGWWLTEDFLGAPVGTPH